MSEKISAIKKRIANAIRESKLTERECRELEEVIEEYANVREIEASRITRVQMCDHLGMALNQLRG